MGVKIAIVGAGPGGYWSAVRAAQLGAEVTVIEEEKAGGTCLHWGCIPSKIMIHASRTLDTCRRAREFGVILSQSAGIEMGKLMQRKSGIVDGMADLVLRLLNHHKINYIKGRAFFENPGKIRIEGGEDIEWDRLILAAGSTPITLSNIPIDGKNILLSDHALGLTEVPESIAIIGGGVIGCEFAFTLSSLGARVVIVEALSRLLPIPSVDEEASKVIERELKKKKVQIYLNHVVTAVDAKPGLLRVQIEPVADAKQNPDDRITGVTVETQKVLLCVGRKPKTSGIGLDILGIKTDQKGWIQVNERLETSVPNVFAIGDILGPSRPMLAHVASREGIVAAGNAAGGSMIMDYTAVPTAIFTTPEVAGVGLTEAHAREIGCDARSDSVLFRSIGKSHVIGEISGYAKIVWDQKTRKTLGVHLVGPHATDLITPGILAVRAGLSIDFLSETIFPHPTLSEVLLEAALKACGRPIHG